MSTARDRRVADDFARDQALMCQASGCPCVWTVDAGKGVLCGAHAWSAQQDWPRITQRLLDDETDRAVYAAAPKPPAPHVDKAAVLAKFRAFTRAMATGKFDRHPKQWALDLESREQRGEQLSPIQRRFWREALGRPATDADLLGKAA